MPTFHTSLIIWHVADKNDLFPHREASLFYNFGTDEEQEWVVNEIIAHQCLSPNDLELQVKGTLGDIMWEPLASCRSLKPWIII